jgi:hypothetical protein
MKLIPLTRTQAFDFIAEKHRHHKPPQGYKFAIGLKQADQLVGVVCVGRPVARRLDDGLTAEATRLCTDGTKNACSKLYSAAAKAAQAMGYTLIVTYTLASESGASLRASGWKFDGEAGGGSWGVPSRPREDKHPIETKHRWSKAL